jgi:hypothetical protein
VPFWFKANSSEESTHNVSVRVLFGSVVVVAAGVASLGVSVTVALGLYETEGAPAAVGGAVMDAALQL